MGNLIKLVRKERGMSVERLAELTGYSTSFISRMQNSKRSVTLNHLEKIADALGVAPADLIGEGSGHVPLVGFVGADAEANLFEEGQGPFEDVDAPEGTTESTVAVEIRGTSLGELFDRWLIYYDDRREPVTTDLLNKLCVVGLDDGKILVKKLRRGRLPRRFDLISNVGPPIYDAAVVWAARVKNMVPR